NDADRIDRCMFENYAIPTFISNRMSMSVRQIGHAGIYIERRKNVRQKTHAGALYAGWLKWKGYQPSVVSATSLRSAKLYAG
ncbi:hypothetical protein, partial [Paraburkholderia aspalathi]|uniref:hypothetical protein n=1 Tax=Paraburkholderia aspalathi TaxID=1324617 RepID=UPI0038B92529